MWTTIVPFLVVLWECGCFFSWLVNWISNFLLMQYHHVWYLIFQIKFLVLLFLAFGENENRNNLSMYLYFYQESMLPRLVLYQREYTPISIYLFRKHDIWQIALSQNYFIVDYLGTCFPVMSNRVLILCSFKRQFCM